MKKQKKEKKKKKAPQKDAMQAKCEEYLSGWKRALADYENLKRENVKTVEEGKRRIRAALAQELLPVMDNFDQAVRHAPDLEQVDEKSIRDWLSGVMFIERQFHDALKSMGVERIETVGSTFDPNLHESAGSRSEEGKDDQEILEEVLAGWKIGEHVIRPAKVVINIKLNT